MKILKILALFLFFSLPLAAAQPPAIQLEPPSLEFQKWCPAPIWRGVKAKWKGMKDLRPQPELATLDSDPPVALYPSRPLGEVFDQSIRELFQVCGIQWVPEGQETAWEIEGTVEKFESGQQKGVFISKTQAKSQVKILAKSFNRGVEAQVGYEIELKGSRFKSFKKIESSLQELFRETLQQLSKSPQLKGLQ